jgi:hypothetical protein
MISLSEGVVIMIVVLIAGIIGWGINRLVTANDKTGLDIGAIREDIGTVNISLATMNGRIGRHEDWQEGHARIDEERHETIVNSHKELWHAVNANRK